MTQRKTPGRIGYILCGVVIWAVVIWSLVEGRDPAQTQRVSTDRQEACR